MIDEASEGALILTYPTRWMVGAGMLPGPVNAVIARVAVASASACPPSWKGSNSLFAAYTWMASSIVVGGAASRRTLSMVVAVQSVAPAGEGSAYVMSPVGVQSVQRWPSPPEPWQEAARTRASGSERAAARWRMRDL